MESEIFRYCLAIALFPFFIYAFFLIYKEYGVVGVLEGSVFIAIVFGWFYFCFEKLPRILDKRRVELKRGAVMLVLLFLSLVFSNFCHEFYHYIRGKNVKKQIPTEFCVLGWSNSSYCFLNESNEIECEPSSAAAWVEFVNVTVTNTTEYIIDMEKEESTATKISFITFYLFFFTFFALILGFEKLDWERGE